MLRSTVLRRSLLALFCLALLPVTQAAEPAHKPSNKWRLVVDGTARSAGDVSFRVTPNGGAPIEVSIKVPANHGENALAKDLRDAFREKLPKKAFHIERDDGEDVLLKKRMGQPDFLVELVSSTVENTSFKLKRE
mgnify:CR=1 FL=1